MLRIDNIRGAFAPQADGTTTRIDSSYNCLINGVSAFVYGFDTEEKLITAARAGKLEPTGKTTASGKSLIWGPSFVPPTAKELDEVKALFIAATKKKRTMNLDEMITSWDAAEVVNHVAAVVDAEPVESEFA